MSPAAAEDRLATILSPADGAKLEAKHTYKLEYEVNRSAKADHVHIYVDGDETGMAHKLKGSFKLGPLKRGARCASVRSIRTIPRLVRKPVSW